MTPITFEQFLAPLNTSQQEAATITEGNLFISAGAGTGKTSTLTAHYVAALLDMSPEDQRDRGVQGVLAITYTKAAAAELNHRIKSALRAIGRQDLARQMGDAWISTFHAFCARVLRAEAPALVGDHAIDPNFTQIDELEAAAMLAQAYADTFEKWAVDRADDLRKLYGLAKRADVEKSIGKVLGCCNTYGCDVGGVIAHSELEILQGKADDGSRPWRARSAHVSECVVALARDVKHRYSEMKDEKRALDFDDLILQTNRILTAGGAVADRYRAQFDRIIIDEFQDTNHLQYETFRAIARNNLSIVGDKNQSIYAFQGAQASVFDSAHDDLSHPTDGNEAEPRRTELGINYRSHSDVLSFVNKAFSAETMFGNGGLVELVSGEGGDPSRPPGNLPARVVLAPIAPRAKTWPACEAAEEAGQKAREVRWVADWVERIHSEGEDAVALADIRILVRSRTRGRDYASELVKRGIPAVLDGGGGLLLDPAVTTATALLRLLDNLDDDEAFVRLMISPLGRVSDQELADIHFTSRATGGTADQRETLWGSAKALVGSGAGSSDLMDVVRSVDRAASALGILPLDAILRAVIAQRGYDLALLGSLSGDVGELLRNQQSYDNLMTFINMAGEWDSLGGSLREFLLDIDRKIAAGETLKMPQPTVAGSGRDFVTIQTIHSSKGLEFPVVIFPVTPWELKDWNPGSSQVGRLSTGTGEYGDAEPIVVASPVSMTKEEVALATSDSADALGVGEPLLRDRGPSTGTYYEPDAWTKLEVQRVERETDEAKRLMYVAASRAKHAVIVSHAAQDFTKSKSGPSGSKIWQAMLEEQYLEGAFPHYSLRPDVPFKVILQDEYLVDSQAPVVGWPASEVAFAAAHERVASSEDGGAVKADEPDSTEPAGQLQDASAGGERAGEDYRDSEYRSVSEGAAEPLTQVSASHIGAYNSCPRRYHLQYRVGAGSLRARDPDDATNLGNALHAILERGWASDQLDDERTLAILRNHRISEPMHEEVRRQARALLSSGSIGMVRSAGQSVSTERQFYVPLGSCTDPALGEGAFLQGYIDLFAVHPDGSVLILDYKSGRGKKRGDYETQAKCYALVALQEDARSVEVRFLMPDAEQQPRGAEQDGPIPYHRFTFSTADVADIEREVLEAVQGMTEAGSVRAEALREIVKFEECAKCGYAGPLCELGARRKRG